MTTVASSAERLNQMEGFLIIVALLMGALHLVMVLFNYPPARAIRLDHGSHIAFTIHTPQKALAVSFLVWSGSLAAEFPGALVPAILCHLLQMISGTLMAQYFRALGSTAKGAGG